MMTVMLTLDLGNNVWLLGVVDDGVLKMVKLKVTGPTTNEWLGTRSDVDYDPSCAVQATFREACWGAGDGVPRNAYPVSVRATEEGTSEGACRGDLAQPLGDDSNGTNCPTMMMEPTTCLAKCSSNTIASGTFMCLASKVRLKSVCPGHDSVMIGDKVLLTLAVVASECPSPAQLHTILANALEVHRDTVKDVFFEVGEEVMLPKDDALLAGQPTARALTLGGDLVVNATEAPDVLLRVAQLPDSKVPVGNRFANALKSALDYMGSVENLRKPVYAPDQVIDFHKACRGDAARPLGNDSVGTNCPVAMVERSSCAAQCNSEIGRAHV